MFDADLTGIVDDTKKTFEKKLLPKGNYDFQILEFTSKDGKQYPCEGKTKNRDQKVDFLAEVISGEFKGERLFHSVAFLPKDKQGSGMSVHFLKVIGQPWEGKVSVAPEAWAGATFRGYVIQDEWQGKKSNKIKGIEAIGVPNAPGSDLPF